MTPTVALVVMFGLGWLGGGVWYADLKIPVVSDAIDKWLYGEDGEQKRQVVAVEEDDEEEDAEFSGIDIEEIEPDEMPPNITRIK